MEAGLKQNKMEARNAASASFKIITESLLGEKRKQQKTIRRNDKAQNVEETIIPITNRTSKII